ncbi:MULTISPECIES: diacylglycerol kinase [Providencia]|uniref:Diacylglycerol kinase n=1 Tax=Providencia heimbachae ATCC 35613 TaxID=1354272 RepID=A0A1B7JRP4_9GAMM|nr:MULTISPECIES: diacylglycerol kinase [Providencia]MBP6124188.1 diacylglycerol kinase [Providencia sp.]MDD9339839.1 diacylglycerol kinase [Providencia heimbachae]NIH21138.1 diacylglycerol kinase [Providencia heimbachae]OAT50384.1 diacylglycerol kinase [Providencia heimbachae ATCC 35613]QCJ68751.1 diacylglycerol kinase [Providencia heimbachae]
MASQTKGFTRVIKAAGYSLKGLKAAWVNEAAFRQEAVAAVIAIIIAFYLDISYIDRILLVSVVVLVAIVELINSAIEAVVDRVGSEFHELSGRAKDIGSAAVFISIGLALFVWGIVLWQRYFVA